MYLLTNRLHAYMQSYMHVYVHTSHCLTQGPCKGSKPVVAWSRHLRVVISMPMLDVNVVESLPSRQYKAESKSIVCGRTSSIAPMIDGLM